MDVVSKITLEDNKEYIIVDAITIENVEYLYLINEEDIGKLCIRKVQTIDNKECLAGLKDELEFQNALSEYVKKHRS